MGGGAPDPDGGVLLVLEEQLRRERDRIDERRRDLDEVTEMLARATSRSLGARDTRAEELPGTVTGSVVNQLLTESRGMVRNFVLTVDAGAGARRGDGAGEPGADGAWRRPARRLPGRGAHDPQRAALAPHVGRGRRGPARAARHRHRVRRLRRHRRRRPRRLGRPRRRVRPAPRPARHPAVHGLLRPRLAARGAGAVGRRARGAATPGSSSCSSSASRTRRSRGTSASACGPCAGGWHGSWPSTGSTPASSSAGSSRVGATDARARGAAARAGPPRGAVG